MMLSLLLVQLLADSERPESYVVQPGDTCDGITRKFWGDPKSITELHRWNELGPTPHRLKPGQVLHLRAPPEQPAGPDATLTFMKPAVRTRRQTEWNTATLGMGLFRLDEVNTLRRAGAALKFRDESTLVMDENALVVVYGDAPKPKEPAGLSLVDGELRVALAALRQKPLAVATPSAAVETAKGAQGVVSVDGSQTSRFSLFEGAATVEARGAQVTVKENHGTRVRPGLAPEPIAQLPDAPQLSSTTARVLVWQGLPTTLALEWSPAARATKYRVQVAHDAQFVDRVDDQWTEGTSARVALVDQRSVQVRVIAFDERGLQSRPSKVASVDLVGVGEGVGEGGFVTHLPPRPLSVTVPPGLGLKVDGAPATPPVVLAVGRHQLDFVDDGGAVASTVKVVVRPRPPALRVERGRLTATFEDEVPKELPPMVGGVALVRQSALVWTSAAPEKGAVVVEWLGLPLVRAERGR